MHQLKYYLLLAGLFVLAFLFYLFSPTETGEEWATTSLSERPDLVEGEASVCYAHLAGEVNQPGVVEFTQGTRLFEIIELGGGFTKEAARDYLNLSQLGEDEGYYYIPKASDLLVVVEEGQASQVEIIDINTARQKQLTSLPGIGQAKAQSIIDYRQDQGGFETLDQIMEVPGIGETLFKQMEDRIKIEVEVD